jgi:hypothetical protein
MKNYGMVFELNFDYYKRVAHRNLSQKKVLLDFQATQFEPFKDS